MPNSNVQEVLVKIGLKELASGTLWLRLTAPFPKEERHTFPARPEFAC